MLSLSKQCYAHTASCLTLRPICTLGWHCGMGRQLRCRAGARQRLATRLALTDDIRLPFWLSLGEKRKLRAARGSGITATRLRGPDLRFPPKQQSLRYPGKFGNGVAAAAPRTSRAGPLDNVCARNVLTTLITSCSDHSPSRGH